MVPRKKKFLIFSLEISETNAMTVLRRKAFQIISSFHFFSLIFFHSKVKFPRLLLYTALWQQVSREIWWKQSERIIIFGLWPTAGFFLCVIFHKRTFNNFFISIWWLFTQRECRRARKNENKWFFNFIKINGTQYFCNWCSHV